jgi:hypothetical protein
VTTSAKIIVPCAFLAESDVKIAARTTNAPSLAEKYVLPVPRSVTGNASTKNAAKLVESRVIEKDVTFHVTKSWVSTINTPKNGKMVVGTNVLDCVASHAQKFVKNAIQMTPHFKFSLEKKMIPMQDLYY